MCHLLILLVGEVGFALTILRVGIVDVGVSSFLFGLSMMTGVDFVFDVLTV